MFLVDPRCSEIISDALLCLYMVGGVAHWLDVSLWLADCA